MIETFIIWIFYASFCSLFTAIWYRIESEKAPEHFMTWVLFPAWFSILFLVALLKNKKSEYKAFFKMTFLTLFPEKNGDDQNKTS